MRKFVCVLAGAMLLLSLCFALASCDEGEAGNTASAASEAVVTSDGGAAASHFVPVASDEVSGGEGFVSIEPDKYPSDMQC